ncbi:putative RNA methyltransferase [Lactococcus nasutitermitis]|uniref:RNA methyltransferase n=1 Tax=Lactococcus nasutitermitis TaxID=1652957 RepID=A0ABV9JCZ9_9LACT|nr:methyltransferase domain-containing protein [Lactococcus nasutitermitis]
MLKKIEKSYLFLSKNLEVLRCPICHGSFKIEKYALICENRHTFNLNKKGIVNFLQTKMDTEHYTRKMFEPRRRLISAGMYTAVLTEIQKHLVSGNLLDVGTGEGTFLEMLHFEGNKFGFDIAKDAVEMATELDITAFFSLSDLTNLSFADEKMTTILNIFTPSNYNEFHRVLTKNGVVIKVVPDKFYLQELRKVFDKPVNYDNQAVVARFFDEFPDAQKIEIHDIFDIPEELRKDFLEMSPLEWAVSPEIKKQAQKNPPRQATIHVQILIGRKK